MPDSPYQFKNHLNCPHHSKCCKAHNEKLIKCYENSKKFMLDRISGVNKTISQELRQKYCQENKNGMLDMED